MPTKQPNLNDLDLSLIIFGENMSEGRKPAQCGNFLRPDTFHTEQTIQQCKSIHENVEIAPVYPHNFCDHNPNQPKFFTIPAHHKPRAKVIQDVIERLKQAYFLPKRMLKTLQFHDVSGHRVKSQRRNACIALLQAMIYYMDDATGRIARNVDGKFVDITLKKLARYAQLKLKRAKRAMVDIIHAGYLRVTRQYERNLDSGVVKGFASIREVLPKFFTDLDIKGKLWTNWFSQRAWKRERQAKKMDKNDRKRSRATMAFFEETVTGIGHRAKTNASKLFGAVKRLAGGESQKEKEARISNEKRMLSEALTRFNADPSKPISEYLRLIRAGDPPLK